MSEHTNHTSVLDESVNENGWGDFGATGLVQKGLNAMGLAFKGTARESFAILLAYFRDRDNGYAYQPLMTIGNALNSLAGKQKNMVSMDDGGQYAQGVGSSVFWGGVDAAGIRGATKGAGKLAARGAGKAATRAIPIVGWALLGADLVNDALNIVQACKNRKDPTFAPRKALDTLAKFFNTRGRKANTQEVQAALQSMNTLVAQDARVQNTQQVQMQNTQNQGVTAQNTGGYRLNVRQPGYNAMNNQYQNTYNNMGNAGYGTQNMPMVAENRNGRNRTVIKLTESELREMVADAATEVLEEGFISGALTAMGARQLLKRIGGKEGVMRMVKNMSGGKLSREAVEKAFQNNRILKAIGDKFPTFKQSILNMGGDGAGQTVKQTGKQTAGGTVSSGGRVSWNDAASGNGWNSTATGNALNPKAPGNALNPPVTTTAGGSAAETGKGLFNGKNLKRAAAVGGAAWLGNQYLKNNRGIMGRTNAQDSGNGYGYQDYGTTDTGYGAGWTQDTAAAAKNNNSPDWQDWEGDPAQNFQKYINSIQKF